MMGNIGLGFGVKMKKIESLELKLPQRKRFRILWLGYGDFVDDLGSGIKRIGLRSRT